MSDRLAAVLRDLAWTDEAHSLPRSWSVADEHPQLISRIGRPSSQAVMFSTTPEKKVR